MQLWQSIVRRRKKDTATAREAHLSPGPSRSDSASASHMRRAAPCRLGTDPGQSVLDVKELDGAHLARPASPSASAIAYRLIASSARWSTGARHARPMARISRSFRGRRVDVDPARVPPGQYVTRDFPVLSAGPTPRTPLDEWSFTVNGAVDEPVSWPWEDFIALPTETVTVDIHCVTKWSKLDTTWTGVSVDTLLEGVETDAGYVTAWCDGGYTTNLPLEDLIGGRAWIAYEYGGEPLAPEHGGPARLLVPHLYFWKSAKWVRGLELRDDDEPGFWETYGYHNYGDPWKEQRYQGD
jgi:DMSO/TMAO reductase YedYZ molybdopterin-dependent catalytic subunit